MLNRWRRFARFDHLSRLSDNEAFRLYTPAERVTNGSKKSIMTRHLFRRIGRSCCAVPAHLSQEGWVSLQIHYKRFGPLPFVFLRKAGFLGHGGKLAVKVPTSSVRFRTKASRRLEAGLPVADGSKRASWKTSDHSRLDRRRRRVVRNGPQRRLGVGRP